MRNLNKIGWICLNEHGNAIAIDPNSGGYPYEAINHKDVEFFFSKEKALEYAKFFKDYKVVEVEVIINIK